MPSTERTNYFKLVALIVDIVSPVISTYIRKNILDSSSFESFLNLLKEKHKLIHVFETLKCCECVSEMIKGEKLISKKQLLVMYKSDESKLVRHHQKYVGGKVVQICICKYIAIENIDVKIIDITLANYIILKCGKQELGIDNWMKQIQEVRNEIFHTSDIQEITDDKFNRKWETLKGSILGIASLINSEFEKETEENICQTKKVTIIPDSMSSMLKNEILCRDYWKQKCAEFERAQTEEFEKKAKALHIQFPEVFSESMERDCQKNVTEIRNLKTIVDNIDILIKVFGKEEDVTSNDTESVKEDFQRVPVFLQLDLPASWNRMKVWEYLDNIRLNGSSDMNINILAVSPDDLNIYSEIARRVLKQVDLLQDEVKKIMSGMLSEATTDPQQNAEVVFSFKIPEITEENSEMNAEHEVEQANNSSTIRDVQTRSKTEFDDELPPNNDPHEVTASLLCTMKINGKEKKDLVIIDCVIIGEFVVFVDNFTESLIIQRKIGSFERAIKLSGEPRGITAINDKDVAVLNNKSLIQIININTGHVQNEIKICENASKGISYQNGLLFIYVHEESIIVVMNLKGDKIRSFSCPETPGIRTLQCLATDTDRLLLIHDISSTTFCCDLDGLVKWVFNDDNMWVPNGVTTDGIGNVYVSCYSSNNVIVISPDGNQYKELLTEKDGLVYPRGIHYDKSSNCLLVCNEWNGNAFLFDVIQK